MSDSATSPETAEPDWATGKTPAEMGRMLSAAQIHVTNGSRRAHDPQEGSKLTDLLASIALAYLSDEVSTPPIWRRQIVKDLATVSYKEGCCTWRD